MTLPIQHREDVLKLESDAYVELYEVNFYPSGSMFISPHRKVTWQGNTYELWGMKLDGIEFNSDDKTARPKLSLANFTYDDNQEPVRGVFSALHLQNALESATVIQRRVLKANLEANADIKEELRWKVSRIASETPDVITLELRNSLDGPRYTIPARKFNPPDFPQVKMT
jgi:lambda family phage minor tail protein L